MNPAPAKQRVKISFSQAMNLLIPYVKKRVGEQLKSVSLITLYLLFFQVVVLRINVAQASVIAAGLVTVILGLSFFIEGLFLGFMPLGETIGVRLPQKTPVPVILGFAFILGVGATLAEPTIGVLRAAGSQVKPWEAPLLFLLLNRFSSYLVMAVGVGVGLAVLTGMLRFLYSWSLKPFIMAPVILLLAFSLWAVFDPNMRSITGVAWDCGAITTGPVTVPLVLALGIGICRVVGSASAGSAGFGVVTLASLYPILTVMLLGLPFLHSVPQPMKETDFASPVNREAARELFDTEERMIGYVLAHGSPEARLALFDRDNTKLNDFLGRLFSDGDLREKVLGPSWNCSDVEKFAREIVLQHVPRDKAAAMVAASQTATETRKQNAFSFLEVFSSNIRLAIRAIIPLTLLLGLVLFGLLRERAGRGDEIVAGILFSLAGLALFNVGMELGLARLGGQIGGFLPSTFKMIAITDESRILKNFDTAAVTTAITGNGEKERFFYTRQGDRYVQIPYAPDRYDPASREYLYTPERGPLGGKADSVWGFLLLFLFALIMGYGATLAEPALTTLGIKVEELTIGIFRKGLLKQSAALGVGLGMAFGVAKVLWDVPLVYLLIPPYLLALVLTLFIDEEFVNIAWDSGGVTTGPVTVPLVLAMGLGVSTQLNVAEGFGILALASVWPILSVLVAGMVKTRERRKTLEKLARERSEGARP